MEKVAHAGAFGAVPEEYCRYETASIAVLPIPYDGTSTWMKGADRGPGAILEASAHMELYDIETGTEVYRRGIVTMEPVPCPDAPEDMVEAVYERASPLLDSGKFLVGLGGEHSVTVGLVRAVSEKYSDLSVLQLDAHSDTRDEYEGSPYSHACVMSRVGEICPYVQAGIRSMDASEVGKMKRDRTFFAHEILSGAEVVSGLLKGLTEDVYITVDLDVLDPAVMPSTGTPEPGGLDWYTLTNLIEAVARSRNVVAMDVTELLPSRVNRAPDFLAAKLVYRTLSMIFIKR